MRIVFDVSPLSHPPTGVGYYIRGTLAGLVEAAGDEHEVIALGPTSAWGVGYLREALEGIPLRQQIRVLPFAHALRTTWSKLGWPPVERFTGPLDVFHYSDWMYPRQRSGVRATTVHDLVPLRYPQWVQGRTRRMHSAKVRQMAESCDVVFCNSQFTAGEVAELVGIEPARLRVAYPAADALFTPNGEEETLGRPYLLSVATLEPRKNLQALLQAYELLRNEPDGRELGLALVGAEGWGGPLPLASERIFRLGYVAREEIARLYRGAAAFVYPSLFEGFGMPILEAMASGAPCVVSSHPSMDEACGEAAVRVDPSDPEALAGGILDALKRRAELAELGLHQARRFSWREAGETMLAGYREAAS
jgi:glycosyltransferase involved in cell wall biosynthesis